MRQRVVDGGDGIAAPRRDRHPGPFGDLFRGDLVTQTSHHVRPGADERDAQTLAHLGERSVFSDEAPSDPDRVRFGVDQGSFQCVVVEVCDLPVAGVVGVERRAE